MCPELMPGLEGGDGAEVRDDTTMSSGAPTSFSAVWTLTRTKQGGGQGKGSEVTTYGALSW